MKKRWLILSGFILLGVSSACQQHKALEDQMRAKAKETLKAEQSYIQKAGLYAVMGDYLLLFKADKFYSEALFPTPNSADRVEFVLCGYKEFVQESAEQFKSLFGLGPDEEVLSDEMSVSIHRRDDSFYLCEGAEKKETLLYQKLYGEYGILIPLAGNQEIAFVSIKDKQVGLMNGWIGASEGLQFDRSYLNNFSDGISVTICKHEKKVEFGKETDHPAYRKQILVPFVDAELDYLCVTYSGLIQLTTKHLNKTIEPTDYPFLYKLIPKQ